MNRLKQKYSQQVTPVLAKTLAVKNINQVPRLEKIVLASGVGRATNDDKQLDAVVATLAKISGQAPVTTKARRSIASFKLRTGMPIGVKVTLRGERMYYFLDRLINIVLPRIRDFRGLSASAFDQRGNYSIGIAEQTVFPEISHEEVGASHGLQVTIITSAKDNAAASELLKALGLPFERESDG